MDYVTLDCTLNFTNMIFDHFSFNRHDKADVAIDSFASREIASDYLTTEELQNINIIGTGITFLHVNCRCIGKNFSSFLDLLRHMHNYPCAIALTETWLETDEHLFLHQI